MKISFKKSRKLLLIATLCYAISTTTVKSKLHDIPAKILSAFVFSFVLIVPSLVSLIFAGFFKNHEPNQDLLIGLGFTFFSIFQFSTETIIIRELCKSKLSNKKMLNEKMNPYILSSRETQCRGDL